ncbi:MAG: SRPBCC domain-containing protein [Rhodobacteraceae bacterium]|nr:SRPBCC domain-containing protein [Paracoccaceae bacterium]
MTADPVRLERRYAVPIERVFDYMTRPELLAKWWGPEHIVRVEGDLDLQRPGPWNSTMISGEGTRHRVSGQVTTVRHPTLVAFTWGWHDEAGRRGHESHVTIELSVEDGGTRLVLTHRDLADAEQVRLHGEGWTSTLRKLDALFA